MILHTKFAAVAHLQERQIFAFCNLAFCIVVLIFSKIEVFNIRTHTNTHTHITRCCHVLLLLPGSILHFRKCTDLAMLHSHLFLFKNCIRRMGSCDVVL